MSRSRLLVVLGSSLAALCITAAASGMSGVALSDEGDTPPPPTTTNPPAPDDNPWHG